MAWLDPRIRCGRCGTAQRDNSAAACRLCDGDFAEVGTECALRDWGVTRRRGRWRWVWFHHVLISGGLLAGIGCVTKAVLRREARAADYLFVVVPILIGSYIMGHLSWRGSEREHETWLDRGGDDRPTPGPDPLPGGGSSPSRESLRMGGAVAGPGPREAAEAAPLEDYCDRCGAFAEGRRRWMFHSHGPPAREFFCARCLRRMRSYAAVGFTLLGLLLLAFCAATLWLRSLR